MALPSGETKWILPDEETLLYTTPGEETSLDPTQLDSIR